MSAEIYTKTVTELSSMIRHKELKPSEVCAAFLDRSKELNTKMNAFITLDADAAMNRALELDKEPITPNTPAMFGIPVALKDNICTEGTPTTAASKMMENYYSPFEAATVTLLKEQGAVIMGKTNMDEFAMGSSSETSFFGPVKNPHDLDRVPGGSSGGSAAAVASGMSAVALGSDTGGSIRLPAAFCGVVGYKPTYGAVSRFGLFGYASAFDQIGPIARSVSDAALLADVICGHDPRDAVTNPLFVPDFSGIDAFSVKGKKIGVPVECFEGVDDDVSRELNSAIALYKSLGAEVEEFSMPMLKNSLPIYYIIALTEGSANLARFDGVRFGHRSDNYDDVDSLYTNSRTEGFGDEVKRRIWLGTYLLSAGNVEIYYNKAQIARAMLRDQFNEAFAKYDAMFTPVAPTPAFRFGETQVGPAMYTTDICTVPVNLAGLPAITIPCVKDKLPIGFQLIGRRFEDADLLGFARAFERESGISNLTAEVK